jgi:hypothetical protein
MTSSHALATYSGFTDKTLLSGGSGTGSRYPVRKGSRDPKTNGCWSSGSIKIHAEDHGRKPVGIYLMAGLFTLALSASLMLVIDILIQFRKFMMTILSQHF